jgi:hypothetical protein
MGIWWILGAAVLAVVVWALPSSRHGMDVWRGMELT